MNDTNPPKAGAREWIGLAVLALPSLLVAIDLFVLLLALPALSADLAPTNNEQLWILDVYGFLLAGFMITMGTLGDRIGKRRLLLIGAVGFVAASVLAAYSTSPEMLIAARALLGIAGAALGPTMLGLIGTMFQDPRQRTTAIGVWMVCMLGGIALGPVVGGVMLEHFWWGSVFLLGVPAMVLLLVLGPILLPSGVGTGVPRAASTSPASASRSRPSCPGSTASRSWPATAGRRYRSPRSRSASRWAWSSYGGSGGWPTRCWTCDSSPTGR
ncbi:hypothetical protein Pflav_090630 [Phytohabitans flavus]|uniref:Major facilitator superfamily (MFS) profile domain-containing protein n=1 Tax=Phytohabitans flavus TaxID=1076124 RepID=A0A6F8Y9F4_9ACTN|nr:hypothetical protein Pflav_090630 [Phytohabitans flavus]